MTQTKEHYDEHLRTPGNKRRDQVPYKVLIGDMNMPLQCQNKHGTTSILELDTLYFYISFVVFNIELLLDIGWFVLFLYRNM